MQLTLAQKMPPLMGLGDSIGSVTTQMSRLRRLTAHAVSADGALAKLR